MKEYNTKKQQLPDCCKRRLINYSTKNVIYIFYYKKYFYLIADIANMDNTQQIFKKHIEKGILTENQVQNNTLVVLYGEKKTYFI